MDNEGPRNVCWPPARPLISSITSLARLVRSSTMLLTKREGIVMSRASPQTRSSLSPMERDQFRIWTPNGKRESWFKRPPKRSSQCEPTGPAQGWKQTIINSFAVQSHKANSEFNTDRRKGYGKLVSKWRAYLGG